MRQRAWGLCAWWLFLLPVLTCASDPTDQIRSTLVSGYEQQVLPLLKTYCFACHGKDKQKGDINFSSYSNGNAAVGNLRLWKSCAAMIAAHEMPPEKETKQPTAAERTLLIAWIRDLKRLLPRDPGSGIIRRLSRREYANTLHDLLGVDPKVADELPSDAVGEGFDSSIPPLLMEKYLLVADDVLDQLIRPDQLQIKWNAGQLDATIGLEHAPQKGKADGAEVRFAGPGEVNSVIPAPVDGTYTIRIRASAEKTTSKEPARLAVRIDNQVIGELRVTAAPKNPAVYTVTCKLTAGRSQLSVLTANPYVEAIPEPTKPAGGQPTPVADKPKPATPPVTGKDGRPVRTVIIDTIEITGPPGGRQSDAQKRLFVAMPSKDLDKREAAKQIAVAFARRAFRRPASEKEITNLLKVYDLADGQGEVFSFAIKLMLKAALISPQFLYLTPDPGVSASGDIVPVGDFQIAARLSYLFWSTMPDDELAALADAGKLRDPAIIAQQVKRLIANPRSEVLFDSFGAPWLGLNKLDELVVDTKKYPLMTKDLRAAMYDEAAMFFTTVMREDRSLGDFITADYTFLNEALARVYEIDGIKGPQLRRVTLNDNKRGGLLTMSGVLAATSLATRTSPVKRGRWVMEQILGQSPPPPPMNVPPLEKQDTAENATLSLRQRTERHRSDPACASCHKVLDPLGFGLENFDPIGRWRDKDDTGAAVDALGELPGGINFRSPQELKHVLAARKDEFCHALVERFLAHALCRHLSGYDEVVVDDLSAEVAKGGYHLQDLLIKVATSYPFLNRRVAR